MSNNFVAMGKLICMVCGVVHSHNASILIDRRLRDIDPDQTVTGYGLCKLDQQMFDDGFVALVVANSFKGDVEDNKLKPKDANRTGEIAHLKRDAFNDMFDIPIDENEPMVYVHPEVVVILQEMKDRAETKH